MDKHNELITSSVIKKSPDLLKCPNIDALGEFATHAKNMITQTEHITNRPINSVSNDDIIDIMDKNLNSVYKNIKKEQNRRVENAKKLANEGADNDTTILDAYKYNNYYYNIIKKNVDNKATEISNALQEYAKNNNIVTNTFANTTPLTEQEKQEIVDSLTPYQATHKQAAKVIVQEKIVSEKKDEKTKSKEEPVVFTPEQIAFIQDIKKAKQVCKETDKEQLVEYKNCVLKIYPRLRKQKKYINTRILYKPIVSHDCLPSTVLEVIDLLKQAHIGFTIEPCMQQKQIINEFFKTFFQYNAKKYTNDEELYKHCKMILTSSPSNTSASFRSIDKWHTITQKDKNCYMVSASTDGSIIEQVTKNQDNKVIGVSKWINIRKEAITYRKCIVIDLDLHDKTALPTDYIEYCIRYMHKVIMEKVEKYQLFPTSSIYSGRGLQFYYVFDTPFISRTEKQRYEKFIDCMKMCNSALREMWKIILNSIDYEEIAKTLDKKLAKLSSEPLPTINPEKIKFVVDRAMSIHAQKTRLPGTLNVKSGSYAQVLSIPNVTWNVASILSKFYTSLDKATPLVKELYEGYALSLQDKEFILDYDNNGKPTLTVHKKKKIENPCTKKQKTKRKKNEAPLSTRNNTPTNRLSSWGANLFADLGRYVQCLNDMNIYTGYRFILLRTAAILAYSISKTYKATSIEEKHKMQCNYMVEQISKLNSAMRYPLYTDITTLKNNTQMLFAWLLQNYKAKCSTSSIREKLFFLEDVHNYANENNIYFATLFTYSTRDIRRNNANKKQKELNNKYELISGILSDNNLSLPLHKLFKMHKKQLQQNNISLSSFYKYANNIQHNNTPNNIHKTIRTYETAVQEYDKKTANELAKNAMLANEFTDTINRKANADKQLLQVVNNYNIESEDTKEEKETQTKLSYIKLVLNIYLEELRNYHLQAKNKQRIKKKLEKIKITA